MTQLVIDPDVFIDDVENHLNRVAGRVKRFRRWTKSMTVFKAFAASTVTALLAISEIDSLADQSDALRVSAIIVSAALAIATAWDALLRPRGQWILYVPIRNQLSLLREQIKHAERAHALSGELLSCFYTRYREIVSESESRWLKLREQDG